MDDALPISSGLTSDQVVAKRREFGWNELPRAQMASPFVLFAHQFRGPLIAMLVLAAGIAYWLGERTDAIVIGLVLILNAILGFVQEWRAEAALDALRAMLSPTAIVVRNGRETRIPARDLVPRDLVIVETGDAVPADLQLLDGAEITVDESTLSGESVAVAKVPGKPDDAGQVFAGTTIVAGRGEGLVTQTGQTT